MQLLQVVLFSVIIILVPTIVRKAVAHTLDSEVTHEIWQFRRFGWKPGWTFKDFLPFGVIFPFVVSFFGLMMGTMYFAFSVLTYDARGLKYRVAKRFGHGSYKELTDRHNGLIGLAGIVSMLVISVLAYYGGLLYFAKMSAYYAFWNMVPFSKLDGTQIFFGNPKLYVGLGIITLIFTMVAIAL